MQVVFAINSFAIIGNGILYYGSDWGKALVFSETSKKIMPWFIVGYLRISL